MYPRAGTSSRPARGGRHTAGPRGHTSACTCLKEDSYVGSTHKDIEKRGERGERRREEGREGGEGEGARGTKERKGKERREGGREGGREGKERERGEGEYIQGMQGGREDLKVLRGVEKMTMDTLTRLCNYIINSS